MAGLFSPQVNPIGTPPGVPDDGGNTLVAVAGVLGNAAASFSKSSPGTVRPTQDQITDAALKPFYAKALESQQLLESGDISALQHKTNLSVLAREVATMSPSMVDNFQGDMETILGINIKEENARMAALRDASDTANVGTNLAMNYLENGNENQKALMAAGSVAAAGAGLDAEQTQVYLSSIAVDIAKREGEIAKVHALNDPLAKKRAIQELGRHLTPSIMSVVIPAALNNPEQLSAIAGSGQGFSIYQNVSAAVDLVEQYWRNELTEAGIVYEEADIKEIMQPYRTKLDGTDGKGGLGAALGRTLKESQGIRTEIGKAAITSLLSEEGIVGEAAARAYDEYMGWLASNDPAAMANVSETLSKFIQEGKLPELLPVFQWTAEMIDTGEGSNLDMVLNGLFENVEIRDGYRVALNTAYYYKEALHEADQFRKRRSQTAGTVLAAETFTRALTDEELNAASVELVGDEVDELMTTETTQLPVGQQAAKDKVVLAINAARNTELERVGAMLTQAGEGISTFSGDVKGVEIGASGLYTIAIDPNGRLASFIRQFGLEPTYRNLDRAEAMYRSRLLKDRREGKQGDRMDLATQSTIAALKSMRPHLDKLNVIENKARKWVEANPALSTENLLSANPARTDREQAIISSATPAQAVQPTADSVEGLIQRPTDTVVNRNSESPAIVEEVDQPVPNTTPLGVTVDVPLASADPEITEAGPILNSLAFFEGPPGQRGSYDTVFGSGTKSNIYELTGTETPVTSMTLEEVLAFADDAVSKGSVSSAVGRYQIIRSTLRDLIKEMKLPMDAVFTPELQDKMALHLLKKKRGYDRFKRGELTVEQFAKAVAQEWASFPVLAETKGRERTVKRGESYYAGDKINSSKFTEEEVIAWENYLRELQDTQVAAVAAEKKES